jgi:Sulfotransferase family
MDEKRRVPPMMEGSGRSQWRRFALRRSGARRPAVSDPPPSPFVVGVARSGTTLLRLMLDAHPDLAVPPETNLIPRLIKICRRPDATPKGAVDFLSSHRKWNDFGIESEDVLERMSAAPEFTPTAAVRAFYDAYAARFGKPRWGDKTCDHARRMPLIGTTLPEARFVHLIRDGRDATLSWRRFRTLRGVDPLTIEHRAWAWSSKIIETRVKARRVAHYMEVRYEGLVSDPEATLREICEFVELPYDERMLAYHRSSPERLAELAGGLPPSKRRGRQLTAEDRLGPHRLTSEPPRADRAGAWRKQMTEAEVKEFEVIAGELLVDLGYGTTRRPGAF